VSYLSAGVDDNLICICVIKFVFNKEHDLLYFTMIWKVFILSKTCNKKTSIFREICRQD
jgi:hypothetical protein